MIDLMLKGSSQQLLASEFNIFTHFIFRADKNAVCPRNRLAKAWDAQAAFFARLRALSFDDLWIDNHEFLRFVLPSTDIDHGYAPAESALRRREANSLRRVHGFPHVGNRFPEFGRIEIIHRPRHLLEHGSRVL